MGKKKNRTELYELGKVRLIDRLTEDFKANNKSTVFGIGDDAAVISTKKKCTVATTDLLLEGIHFDLTYFPLKHLGYKAIVTSISDIYAMNATPTQILVSIGISKRFSVEDLEMLYSGVKLACQRYKVDLVGGDTTSSYTGLTISVTAIGEASADEIVYRNGAKVNDLICVSGNFGAAYIGLQLLEREKQVFESNPNAQPQFSGYDYLLGRILKPEARYDVIETLRLNGIKPTSMIDVSDGLSSELLHICKSSDVGCRIFFEKIPIDEQTAELSKEFNIEPHVAAMNGGEDYELLFTVPLADFDKVASIEGITVIGHIADKEQGAYLVPEQGNDIRITAQGWNSISE